MVLSSDAGTSSVLSSLCYALYRMKDYSYDYNYDLDTEQFRAMDSDGYMETV